VILNILNVCRSLIRDGTICRVKKVIFKISMETPIFSAEQIRIPPELPEILKNYAKFIIKTHPQDIFQASAEYDIVTKIL
jgi:hypothetical protein